MRCNSSTLPEAVKSVLFWKTQVPLLQNGKANSKRTKSEDLLSKTKPNRFWIKRQADEKDFSIHITLLGVKR